MLLSCCSIHISIIILRYFCLLYLCPCLALGLFLLYLCGLFFINTFIFILNKYMLAFLLILYNMSYYMHKECEWLSNIYSSASWWCLAFVWFFDSLCLTLLIKALLIKKVCNAAVQQKHKANKTVTRTFW